MPVLALQVLSAEAHPNADSLFIHQLGGPARAPVQIIANERQAVGQVMAVALIGAQLKDGTKIRKARLRGVDSFGMFLEPVEEPPGAELTARYCDVPDAREAPEAKLVKWTDVGLLHNVRRALLEPLVVRYRAKVKLDGTNAGVQLLPSGQIVAQSRSRVLSLKDDNAGFAAWVQEHRAYFEALAHGANGAHRIIFGEWCGPGVQKRAAVSKIDRRIFAVFAVQLGDHERVTAQLQVEPEKIRAMLPEHKDIFVLPWEGEPITLNFGDPQALSAAAEALNQRVEMVEACDPWVRSVFGVEGLGEGIVMYPEPEGLMEREAYTRGLFKAKGEKHQVVRQKRPAQLEPEVAASVEHFVELFVTEPRLLQGVQEACKGELDMRHMGDFLKWLGQDVKKESGAELEASGLSWKEVSKAVTQRARGWYGEKVRG